MIVKTLLPTVPNQKPRVQGKIANLPSSQREQVNQWFRENLTYAQIKERLKSELDVSIGITSLARYYSKHGSKFSGKKEPASEDFELELVLHIRIRPEVCSIKPVAREAAE